jgi:hypothetical protein
MVEKQGLGPVVQAEAFRLQQCFGVELAGVEANREPLDQVSGIRRILEWRSRMELMRLGFEHAVFARADEESAVIERHAQVSPGDVNVSYQHVEELVGHVVEQTVAV